MPTIQSTEPQPAGEATTLQVEVSPLHSGEDKAAFRRLNEEWIIRHFALEKKDRETLEDPDTYILGKGGAIFMARLAGEREVVGCVALIPMDGAVFELSKMAVSPALRGRGIGRTLLQHTISQARSMGARSLFLGSNSKLPAAVRLYESIGFRHVPAERLPAMGYARADVFMEMSL